ncbi:MAG: hypothetical protein J5621_07360 [Paludibacteraceae bacterium]|nr:hypothetical protein [Paludibacteraceae bacterium]
MKTKFLFLGLLLISLTSCWLGVDYIDFKPVYYVVNQSEEVVYWVYTLQPNAVVEGIVSSDTIEINAKDTAALIVWGNQDNRRVPHRNWAPSRTFSQMSFLSESGKVLQSVPSINDDEWESCPVKDEHGGGMFAMGWLYEYKKE